MCLDPTPFPDSEMQHTDASSFLYTSLRFASYEHLIHILSFVSKPPLPPQALFLSLSTYLLKVFTLGRCEHKNLCGGREPSDYVSFRRAVKRRWFCILNTYGTKPRTTSTTFPYKHYSLWSRILIWKEMALSRTVMSPSIHLESSSLNVRRRKPKLNNLGQHIHQP